MTQPSHATLEREPTPLYTRIKEDLRGRILDGIYQPHERVPSEAELMQQYRVSRITVRQALSDLEKENLIFKVPGKGSFVSKPKPFQPLGRLQGFGEAMASLGHQTHNRLLDVQTVSADSELAARLGLANGSALTRIERVRYLNRAPVSLDITWLPQHVGARLAREDLVSRDIFSLLENDLGLALGYADLTIDAVLADPAIASALGIAAGEPVLRIERLTHERDGKPLDFEYLYCRPDNFQYRLRVAR
jgi:GntR family transcriptional regulator